LFLLLLCNNPYRIRDAQEESFVGIRVDHRVGFEAQVARAFSPTRKDLFDLALETVVTLSGLEKIDLVAYLSFSLNGVLKESRCNSEIYLRAVTSSAVRRRIS
jgi:hypothetical protein